MSDSYTIITCVPNGGTSTRCYKGNATVQPPGSGESLSPLTEFSATEYTYASVKDANEVFSSATATGQHPGIQMEFYVPDAIQGNAFTGVAAYFRGRGQTDLGDGWKVYLKNFNSGLWVLNGTCISNTSTDIFGSEITTHPDYYIDSIHRVWIMAETTYACSDPGSDTESYQTIDVADVTLWYPSAPSGSGTPLIGPGALMGGTLIGTGRLIRS